MPSILAIDTAAEACSVALARGDNTMCEFALAPRQHSQLIFSMLRQLIPNGDLQAAGVDALAFSSGPGSFTGLRIAASVVQGLAFAQQLPVAGISTLALQAQTALRHRHIEADKPVLSVIDARLNEVYACEIVFHDGLAVEQGVPVVCGVNQLIEQFGQLPQHSQIVGAGLGDVTGLSSVCGQKQWLLSESCIASAEDLIPLARAAFAQGKGVSALEVLPRYVRDEVSWKKLPEQGKRAK